MRNRILTGWTWIRGAFLFLGLWMIIQTALEGEWLGIILGLWLSIMGLFGLGCAAGNCFNGNCEVSSGNDDQKRMERNN